MTHVPAQPEKLLLKLSCAKGGWPQPELAQDRSRQSRGHPIAQGDRTAERIVQQRLEFSLMDFATPEAHAPVQPKEALVDLPWRQTSEPTGCRNQHAAGQ